MKKIKIQCPAKINLYLKVLDKRKDGYHNIDTSFQLIDLADEMSFEISEKDIHINSNEDFLCDENNTIYKSAMKIKEMFDIKNGVKINIEKKIPVGAGLGGGSSNAASTLVALKKLWNLDIDTSGLIDVAQSIGADVPFFIFGKNSIGSGIGEKLKFTNAIKENLILIQPDIHNSTKEMFNEFDTCKEKNIFFANSEQNDFWDIFIMRSSAVKEFYEQVSKDYELNLTGTGSCMYVRYNNEEELNKILKKIPSNWRFFFCKPLQYSPICYI